MLQAAGAAVAIVGHSERRALFGETDEVVARKLAAGLRCGLNVILCVGETLEEREKSATFDVIGRQARAAFAAVESDQTDRLTIAYEPVWAIGTGRNASPEQAEEVHAFIRPLIAECFGEETAKRTRIQYGGSVKPSNVKELMACPNVDGALVGGASLQAEDFSQIVKFAES